MLTVVFFILQILVCHFLVSMIVCSAIYKALDIDFQKDKSILFYSLFLGLPFNTLLLYYFFLFIPNLQSCFYVTVIYGLNISMAIWSRKSLLKIADYCVDFFKINKGKISLCIASVIVLMLTVYVFKKPMTEHDTLEYAIQATIFSKERSITYTPNRFDESGFYFVGLHGFGFPLILSWELMQANLFNLNSDYFFKSTSLLYAFFTLFTGFFIVKEFNLKYPLLIIIIIAFTFGFVFTSLQFNIDHYRIYPMILSTMIWFKSIKLNSKKLFYLFCFLAGIQSFMHSIGMIFGIIQLLTFLIFCNFSLLNRFKTFAPGIMIFLISGAIHYVLDVFFGTGWIFKEIKFH